MSARIYRFPKPFRRRPCPPPPAPVCYTFRPYTRHDAGFGLLVMATLLVSFCYLTGVVNVARHDALYASVLATVWGLYFIHPPLLRIRVLGPLLVRTGQLSLIASVAGFFGFVYWIVLTHP